MNSKRGMNMTKKKTDRNRTKPIDCLTDRQRKALPILLQSKTIAEGCRRARLNPDTFYQWRKQPDFRKAYEQQTDEMILIATDDLKHVYTQSMAVLSGLLSSRSETVRLQAIRLSKEMYFENLELNIQVRLSALERGLSNEPKPKRTPR